MGAGGGGRYDGVGGVDGVSVGFLGCAVVFLGCAVVFLAVVFLAVVFFVGVVAGCFTAAWTFSTRRSGGR